MLYKNMLNQLYKYIFTDIFLTSSSVWWSIYEEVIHGTTFASRNKFFEAPHIIIFSRYCWVPFCLVLAGLICSRWFTLNNFLEVPFLELCLQLEKKDETAHTALVASTQPLVQPRFPYFNTFYKMIIESRTSSLEC